MRVLVLRILHHADDFEVRRMSGVVAAEVLPDGIPVREEPFGEPLIDDRNPRRRWRVLFGDGSSAKQTCSDGRKIVGTDAEP